MKIDEIDQTPASLLPKKRLNVTLIELKKMRIQKSSLKQSIIVTLYI